MPLDYTPLLAVNRDRYSSASIAYETYLFGLMMVGVLKSGKDGYGNSETLLDILIRDGTLGFLGVFSEHLWGVCLSGGC